MGKNSVIKTLGKRIGNVVLHKLLVKYTNKPESKVYLQNEELEYRAATVKEAKKYNWNEDDKHVLKKTAIEYIKDKKNKKYEDVNFSFEEAEKLVAEEIIDLKL